MTRQNYHKDWLRITPDQDCERRAQGKAHPTTGEIWITGSRTSTIGPDYTPNRLKPRIKFGRPIAKHSAKAVTCWRISPWPAYHCQDAHMSASNSKRSTGGRSLPNRMSRWYGSSFICEFTHFEWICFDDVTSEQIAKGSVCWCAEVIVAVVTKSEQLTFTRDVFASEQLLRLINT